MGSYYVMKEMPDLKGTGERILYPQFAQIEQISTRQLVESIRGKSTFSEGEIEGLIRMIAHEMAYEMAQGHSVKLDGIGTFTPSLALQPGKEREEPEGEGGRRNARSIRVGSVNFRVEKKLVQEVNLHCKPVRAPWKARRSSQKYTEEERLTLALQYLDTEPYLSVADYQKLTGLLRTAATEELRRWASDPDTGIGIAGRGTHRVYVKREKQSSADYSTLHPSVQ